MVMVLVPLLTPVPPYVPVITFPFQVPLVYEPAQLNVLVDQEALFGIAL